MDLTLTDRDGDELGCRASTEHPGGTFFTAGPSGTILTREQTLGLYHALGNHLMAHEPEQPEQPELPDATVDGYDWPQGAGSILEEAHTAVYGDRQDDYGHPREDMTRQAIIWTGLLHHKLADGAHLEPEDIARCMVGTKLARDVNAPKRDNRVDGAGYFLCLDRLETGR